MQKSGASSVFSATQTVGTWLRESQKVELFAVGHRVAHGGPDYSGPVLIDNVVLKKLERYVPLAPLHQPNNLAPSTPDDLSARTCLSFAMARFLSSVGWAKVAHSGVPECTRNQEGEEA